MGQSGPEPPLLTAKSCKFSPFLGYIIHSAPLFTNLDTRPLFLQILHPSQVWERLVASSGQTFVHCNVSLLWFLGCGQARYADNLVVSVFASKAEVTACLNLHAELLNLKECRSSVSAVIQETNFLQYS